MDLWALEWGWLLVPVGSASGLLTAVLAIGIALLRGKSPHARYGRAARGARPLAQARAGDRVIARGRIELDGAPARRFDDDTATCAVSTAETGERATLARGTGLYLRIPGGARLRIAGPIDIAGADDDRRVGVRRVRVASLAIGEEVRVATRLVRGAPAGDETTYRDATASLELGSEADPVVALGVRAARRRRGRLVLAALLPALSFALVVSLVGAVAQGAPAPEAADQVELPAPLVLGLVSPFWRTRALGASDRWLRSTLDRAPQASPEARSHWRQIAAVLRVLRPDCDREVQLALVFRGYRADLRDSCDAAVGRALLSQRVYDDPRQFARAAATADLLVSVDRARALEPELERIEPTRLNEEEEWFRAEYLVVRGLAPRLAAHHLRRLAAAESYLGHASEARTLLAAARLLGADREADDAAAAVVSSCADGGNIGGRCFDTPLLGAAQWWIAEGRAAPSPARAIVLQHCAQLGSDVGPGPSLDAEPTLAD